MASRALYRWTALGTENRLVRNRGKLVAAFVALLALTFVVIVCASIVRRMRGDYPPGPQFVEMDQAVFDVVLADFLAESDGNSRVDAITPARYRIDLEDALEGQLDSERHDVPSAIIRHLRRRNREPVSLVEYNSRLPTVSLVHIGEGDHANRRRSLRLFLPGYSANRHTALVRFFFPSGKSAVATYFLKRESDSWTIVWRFRTFYG